jgi:hypothetical protein
MIKFQVRIALGLLVALLAAAALAVNLKTDSIGGFKLGDSTKTVIAKLGPPADKKAPEFAGEATGEWYFVYRYPAQGLDFTFVGRTKQSPENDLHLGDISAYGPSTAKTTKGIGIGSTKAEVKKAYGSSEEITDEKEWCGLFVTYKGDKVAELSLSFTKMPE